MNARNILNIARSPKDNGTLFLGDTRFGLEAMTQNFSDSDCVCRVTRAVITLSSHAGTHADTPAHFLKKSEEPIEKELYSGASIFLNVSSLISGVEIGESAIKSAAAPLGALAEHEAERILIRTNKLEAYPSEPQEMFPYLGRGAIEFLKKLGARVIFIDTPSVDPVDQKNLEAGSHGDLYRAGIMPVENIAPPNIESCRCDIFTVFDQAREFADAVGISAIIFQIRP